MIFKVLNYSDYSINPEFSGVQSWGKPWTTPFGATSQAAPGVWDNIPDVLDTSGPELRSDSSDHPHGQEFLCLATRTECNHCFINSR